MGMGSKVAVQSQQDEARASIKNWFEEGGDQTFFLSGYAGTGKTYTAANLPGDLGLPFGEGGVGYAAFTGKAAAVLASKGCQGARTLHSLLYLPQAKAKHELERMQEQLLQADIGDEDADAEPLTARERRKLEAAIDKLELELAQPGFVLNPDSDLTKFRLLIVDECSMVSADMAEDLLGFDVRTIVMGDPAQLPPVGGPGAFDTDTPDYLLTEIRRQVEDSPILTMATMVREGRKIPRGKYGDSRAYMPVPSFRYAGFDQILVGRNATRVKVNDQVRTSLGRKSRKPAEGDKLIVLENNRGLSVLNGNMFTVVSVEPHTEPNPETVTMVVRDDEGTERPMIVWSAPFRDGIDGENEIKKFDHFVRQRNVFATYGFAITVHKSQGSQWNNVLVLDESGVFRKDADKWLYTAITRAAERVVVAR